MASGIRPGGQTAPVSPTALATKTAVVAASPVSAQKMMLEEMVFASNEILDRTRTETHLLSEFVSKMAGSHSVKDLKMMGKECAQHQLDFIRRDSERIFKHGERMLEVTSKLFQPQD
jgi:hypothetical protein